MAASTDPPRARLPLPRSAAAAPLLLRLAVGLGPVMHGSANAFGAASVGDRNAGSVPLDRSAR